MTQSLYMHKSAAKIALAAAFCAALFASCARSSGDSGQVSFRIDASLANAVSASISPDIPASAQMDIKLAGGAERSATIAVREGEAVVFDEIPAGVVVKATGLVRVGQLDKNYKSLYQGESVPLTVRLGDNRIKLDLKKVYYISFNLLGGTWVNGYPENDHYQKGKLIDLPTSSDVSLTDKIFGGWLIMDDEGKKVPFSFTEETSGDLVLYAKWMESAVQGISIAVDRDASDIELAYQAVEDPAAGPSVVFSVTPPELPEGADFFEYDWWVDDVKVASSTSADSYTFVKAGKTKGVYDIKVIVKAMSQDGAEVKRYSAFAQAEVDE